MHKVTLVCLFVFLSVAFILAQQSDLPDLKIIKSPQISLDQVNQVPDREKEAVQNKISQTQEQISSAVQDTLQPDTTNTVFILRIGSEKLTAVNKYEAQVLKSMGTMHKVLAMQKARGLITQEQYETACLKMVQTFRSAMIQRPLFDKSQG
jgi:hypothetical protein